jgi:hypothetical protein
MDELPENVQARVWKSSRPIFGVAQLGQPSEQYYLAADSSMGTTTEYDMLYFDLDRDGRFSDRERIEPSRAPTHEPGTFGPFRIDVSSGKRPDGSLERTPQWFTARVYPASLRIPGQISSDLAGGFVLPAERVDPNRPTRKRSEFLISLTNMGYYLGYVRFGDEKLLVGVSDANGDGVYSTNSTVRLGRTEEQELEAIEDADAEQNRLTSYSAYSPDRLLIDRDGDGQFDDRRGPDLERMSLGRYFCFKGRFYSLGVAPDGTSVTVSPVDLPTGTLEWTGALRSLILGLVGTDERRADVLHVPISGESVMVPSGRYVVLQSDFALKDPSGGDWQFYRMLQREPSRSSILDVPVGSHVKLPLGPPIEARVMVLQPNADSHTVTLAIELKGADGQLVNPPPPSQRRPSAVPQVRITDPSGANELALLDCNRGRANQWTAVWRLPTKLKGELRASAILNIGSIPSRTEPTTFHLDSNGQLLPSKSD